MYFCGVNNQQMCRSCEHNHKHHYHEHHVDVVCGNNDYGFVACNHHCCNSESDCDSSLDIIPCSCLECRENHTSYIIPLTFFTALLVAYLELYATFII